MIFIEKYFGEKIIYEKFLRYIPKKLIKELFNKKNITLHIYSNDELKKYINLTNNMRSVYISECLLRTLIYGNNQTLEILNNIKKGFNLNSNDKMKDFLIYGIKKQYAFNLLRRLLENDRNCLINYINNYYWDNSHYIKKIYKKYKKNTRYKK